MKRTHISPESKKKRAERPARRECVAFVVARDECCQWPVLQSLYLLVHPDEAEDFLAVSDCGPGELTAHEPAHARNVGRTNPDASIASCWFHNQVAETSAARHLAERIGFIKRGNHLPIRKYGADTFPDEEKVS